MSLVRRSVGSQLSRVAPVRRGAELDDGSRVAVIGGGPGGSLFSYFVLKMAESAGIDLSVDIYEPRQFTRCGPAGCNHCGGIISESLVQLLATEGINLPSSVVQRGIEAYVLHMDVGTTRIETPLREKRIAAVFRGNGPRDAAHVEAESFDRYLQQLAIERGARLVPRLVTDIARDDDGEPRLKHSEGEGDSYDLVALAVGVNSNLLRRMGNDDSTYRPPRTVATYICELQSDAATVQECLGNAMHVFLLNIPRIEFAAMIPKGEIVTLCMLGEDIDPPLVQQFLNRPEVQERFPSGAGFPPRVCHCSPLINVSPAIRPYDDRLVVLGDCGTTRLYKDGIGAAYRTAKAAAVTSVFQGVSRKAFHDHYLPLCRKIERDNWIGKTIFGVNHYLQRAAIYRRATLQMVRSEQSRTSGTRHMSRVLWDLFTGSAPYREVLKNSMHPGFGIGMAWNLMRAAATPRASKKGASHAQVTR